MFKYAQYVIIVMVGALLGGCGSKVTTLQDTTPAPTKEVEYDDDRNYEDQDEDEGERHDPAEDGGDEAGHDPALGQPAPPAFSEANPCQTSANYLCVIAPMYWNIRVLGPQLVQLPFERNLDTAQEYRIHASFTPTVASFRLRNTQQIPGVARGFYHGIFYGYPHQVGQQLIASSSPVMTRLNNMVASYGRFPIQHQHVELGIARRQNNESRCDYKAIFYHHSQNEPVAYVSGTGDCEFNNY